MILRADDIPPTAWKNGGGATRELLRLPAGTDDWRVRLSVADIAADGPFSPFPGVTRHFAVLSGAGVQLAWPGGRRTEHRIADPALVFDGAMAPECRLLGGPTRDLNLMVRDGVGAELRAARWGAPWQAAGRTRAVFTRHGALLHAGGAAAITLPPLTLFWLDDAVPMTWTLSPIEPGDDGDPPPAWWIMLDPTDVPRP